ncbi:MAG: outer membrane protein [Acidimicrobiia bacterium]
MRIGALAIASLTLLGLTPAVATADGMFTPFLGGNFAGDTGGFAEKSKRVYGASLAFTGNVAGFEIDFSHSPEFLGEGDGLIEASSVTTLMGSLLLGALDGPVRPYVAGGFGLLRANVDSVGGLLGDIDRNDLGINLGGGLAAMVGGNVGVRGDIRYFRSLQSDKDDSLLGLELGSLDFWRATVGLSISW